MTVLSSKRKVAKKAINRSIDVNLEMYVLILRRTYFKKEAAKNSSNSAMYDKEIRRRRKLARVAP